MVNGSEINFIIAATWQFDILSWQCGGRHKALRAWEEVASRHTRRRFNYAFESIDAVSLPKLYCNRRDPKSREFIVIERINFD